MLDVLPNTIKIPLNGYKGGSCIQNGFADYGQQKPERKKQPQLE